LKTLVFSEFFGGLLEVQFKSAAPKGAEKMLEPIIDRRYHLAYESDRRERARAFRASVRRVFYRPVKD